MKKTVYLMRHGETLFNTMKLNQGQCDSPLTENGIRQALAAKEWFRKRDITFGAVYSSTAERACDTAELVTDKMPYTRLKGLKEIYLGTWEATSVEHNPTYPYGDYFIPMGGESLEGFTERIHSTLLQIARTEERDPILVVSHGLAIRRFLVAIGHIANDTLFAIGNCGILRLTFENDSFTVEELADPNPQSY